MFAVGFIGQSGTGKTTLMEKVVARLVSRGRRVSAVKSTHHDTDIDQPGKDSWRFRKAGANEVILAGKDRWGLMKETPEAEVPLSELLKRLEPADIVMVEGFKADASIPRILVWRNRPEAEPFALEEGVVAVATDDETLVLPEGITRLDINSPGAVANFIITLKADSDHV